ncbi:MAG: sulfotransferase, partial [Methyloceanibacter sp.]
LALLDHVSSDYSVMVDSSNTSWGSGLVPFRLRKKLGRDVLLIHLVRDPRAVCWSTLRTLHKHKHKEPGTELGRYLRTVFGWMGANLACEAFGFLHSDRYLRIRYEDIVRSPQVTLPSIFEAADLEPARFDHAVASDNRHQLHGNSVRREPLLLATLNEDVAWKAQMPGFFRRLTVVLTVPFFLKYGYFRSGTVQHNWPKKASATESPPVS